MRITVLLILTFFCHGFHGIHGFYGVSLNAAPPAGYDNTPYIPDSKWRVHDKARPRPEVVKPDPSPTLALTPVEGATVLFNGTDLKHWHAGKKEVKWQIKPADKSSKLPYVEIVPKSGNLYTNESFGDIYLHLEFCLPVDDAGKPKGRGNSGVYFMNLFEVQVFESLVSAIYADGQCAAIYGQFPPEKNVTLKAGEWQTYDIYFQAPRYKDGKLARKAIVTVFHNGVKVHDKREILGPTLHKKIGVYSKKPIEKGPIRLQDHSDPVRYRNIWLRPLKEDEAHVLAVCENGCCATQAAQVTKVAVKSE